MTIVNSDGGPIDPIDPMLFILMLPFLLVCLFIYFGSSVLYVSLVKNGLLLTIISVVFGIILYHFIKEQKIWSTWY